MGILSIGIHHYAQVGINTNNPQGIFHIDAKGDTSGNTNVTDDVIVTKDGNIGIGTILPQAKVDIYSTVAGAIRIEDGNVGAGRAMLSDNTGVGKWSPVPGGWYAILRGGSAWNGTVVSYAGITFTSSVLSQTGVGAAALNGQVTVPYAGNYRLTAVGVAANSLVTNAYFIAWLSIFLNGTEAWSPHIMGHTDNGSLSFGFSTILNLKASDKLLVTNRLGYATTANSLAQVIFTVEYLM